ncbi:MAG: hypothetical protein LBU86_06530 [Oscillospiraceae bacterium]|jgi:hypothetical protein|nr:hypothetical protein [Oscillospiraceae bacterium]
MLFAEYQAKNPHRSELVERMAESKKDTPVLHVKETKEDEVLVYLNRHTIFVTFLEDDKIKAEDQILRKFRQAESL